jgi:hypothetical protein
MGRPFAVPAWTPWRDVKALAFTILTLLRTSE